MAKQKTEPAAAPADEPEKVRVQLLAESKHAWTHEGQPVKPGETRDVWPDQAERLIAAGIVALA